jgi:hypothetical protein
VDDFFKNARSLSVEDREKTTAETWLNHRRWCGPLLGYLIFLDFWPENSVFYCLPFMAIGCYWASGRKCGTNSRMKTIHFYPCLGSFLTLPRMDHIGLPFWHSLNPCTWWFHNSSTVMPAFFIIKIWPWRMRKSLASLLPCCSAFRAVGRVPICWPETSLWAWRRRKNLERHLARLGEDEP